MTLGIKIDGLDTLLAQMQKAGANVRPLVTVFLNNVTSHVQGEARRNAPHRTGNLQRHILKQIKYPNAEVQVSESYGLYVEQGTGLYGPHKQRIKPTSRKALAFKVGGVSVIRRSVAGMKAQPFFEPAVKSSISFVEHQLQELGDRLVTIMAGKQ